MNVCWGVLLHVVLWFVVAPAGAQGLQCNGGNKVFQKTCGSCPAGMYQTRSSATCTQPINNFGNGCGTISCETCTCQQHPSGVGDADWVEVFKTEPKDKGKPPVRVDPANDTSPTPILRGGDLTKTGWPTPNPYHTSDQARCFSLVEWQFASDPASDIFFVTIKNNCNSCLTGSFLVSNQHRQFASTGPNRHASRSNTFTPGSTYSFPFSVHNRAIWERSSLFWQIYESHFVQCAGSGTPTIR